MSETAALLITDLVGSTSLVESLGETAAAAFWHEHDRVARDLLRAWRGREIDKSDGLLVLFADVHDAVACARAYHRALAALPRSVTARAGVHLGPVVLRENSPADIALGAKPLEVDGLAKPMAARVMAVACGGQTLLSADARGALDDTLLPLRSHGHWQFKGIAQPIELFEAFDPGSLLPAPADTEKGWRVVPDGAGWQPARRIPNNLPRPLSSFVGRERECAVVAALIDSRRLVTLCGTGGLGKTRLSIEVARASLPHFADGVWFVELAPLLDASLVPQAVASVLGVREETGGTVAQALARFVAGRRLLLVLDNCEHVVAASADLVAQLLRAGTGLHVLASSREPLRVDGETVHLVSPLEVPGTEDTRVGSDLLRFESVRLFAERAARARPGFVLAAAHASAVVSICQRLEGIALAIELAAARVGALPVETIAARLDDHFNLLSRGSRGAPQRQQTLRALIDWSHDLLAPAERALLARLSVFSGGWTLGAAEAVCADGTGDGTSVLDGLTTLVDKSLVSFDAAHARYRVLETVRHYARDRLNERGETQQYGARHLAHFLAFAEAARPAVKGADQPQRLAQIDAEHDNLRTALAWSANEDTGDSGLRLAGTIWPFWNLRGLFHEGRGWLSTLLERAAGRAAAPVRARALRAAGVLAHAQGDSAASASWHAQCLALQRELGDRQGIATSLESLGIVAYERGHHADGIAQMEQALELQRQLGDPLAIAQVLNNLGATLGFVGERTRARTLLEESLSLKRAHGDRRGVAMGLDNLGDLAASLGDAAAARLLFEESLTIRRDLDDRAGIARALLGLADLANEQGDAATALGLLAENLSITRELGDLRAISHALEGLADAARSTGEIDRELRLRSHAQRLREQIDYAIPPTMRPRHQKTLDTARAALADDAAFTRAWQAGRAMTLAQVTELGLQVDPPAAAPPAR